MRPPRLLLAGSAAALFAAVTAVPAAAGTVQTLDATARIVAVDPVDAAGADTGLRTVAVADVAGRLVSLPAEQSAGLRSGEHVTVTAVPGSAGLRVRSVRAAQPPPEARVAARGPGPLFGTHRLTVLPIYWTTPDTSTRASLTALASSAAAYWSAQSGGRIAIAPTVRDWVRTADPRSCDPARLVDAALSAHGVALPVSPFEHVAVYFPTRSDCGGWAGLGQLDGSLIWDNGLPLTDVLAHEFGHNLGLGHANAATCTASGVRVTLTVGWSTGCVTREYRDYADVMGAAMDSPSGNLNTALADSLGLVTAVTVPAGGRAAVDLAPLGQVQGTRAVKIRLDRAWLYADYRPAVAPDTRVPAWAGVQLHLLPDATYPASRLLDGRPATAFSAVALAPGTSWPVPGAGVTLTVTSQSASGARVTVTPTTSGAATPVPVITAPAARAVVGPSTTVAWRSTADVTTRVLVDGTVRYTAAGSARAGSTVVAGLAAGAHVLTVQSVTGTGTVTAASAPVTVTVDTAPPSVPNGLRLSETGALSWRASSDAGSGVLGYLLALDDGAPSKVGTATSVTVRTPSGRHTWWVAALDRVGNLSAASGVVVSASARAGVTGAATVRVVRPAADVPATRTVTTARTIGGLRSFEPW